MTTPRTKQVPLLSRRELREFADGRHARLYEKLGAHVGRSGRQKGTHFAVWAPNARQVSVIGDFNGWDPTAHPMTREAGGVWRGFCRGVADGNLYKYHVVSKAGRYTADKADPFGQQHEQPPSNASIVREVDYVWGDDEWMSTRGRRMALDAPVSVYEVHLGSWRRALVEGYRLLSYRELADALVPYVVEQGFTHVEFLPVMEHPFYGSWGYQVTGYFAPTSRYGPPEHLMYLVDRFHRAGIGVILDWVPSHFPGDGHGLVAFDGTPLFEHPDPHKGFHPDWNSYVFNYERGEVRSFLISSAVQWLDRYHADGLRVDAVASMLYLDYSRTPGQWTPNAHGGRENLEAVEFIKQLNTTVYALFPGVQTVAEESTAWPMVSRPTSMGGLGFGLKWDMGWMHDTLQYIARDPAYREYHHNELTFRSVYAFAENFMLPLSHDEVVYGKRSLFGKMPGDDWQRFANLRLLLAYMYASPGKKLLFMGGEFGQPNEWNHDAELEWGLLGVEQYAAVAAWVRELNRAYRQDPALHELDCEPEGFEWVEADDAVRSVVAFLRKGRDDRDQGLVVCNFTPVPRPGYRIGVPRSGSWREVLNSDARRFSGSGLMNGDSTAEAVPSHGQPYSLELTLPPLAGIYLRWMPAP